MTAEPKSPFGDREMHRLFRAFREHVVSVLRDFTKRVMGRVELVARGTEVPGPPAEKLLGEGLVEVSNLVVGAIKAQALGDDPRGDEKRHNDATPSVAQARAEGKTEPDKEEG